MNEITVIDIISVVFTGVISGVVASIMFYILLLAVRPKIYVSDNVCRVQTANTGTLIHIKVVNKTHCMLTNVKYVLNFCKYISDGVFSTDEIPPLKIPLTFIDKYSEKDEDAEYAVRFSYVIPSSVCVSDGWLEFSIYAEHEFSNTVACVKKRYKCENMIDGTFESASSMRITSFNTENIMKIRSKN